MVNVEWQSVAQAYLARLAAAECVVQRGAHRNRGRRMSTFRYNPTEYHRHLVELLGRNDEEGFKALKLEQGYASALGV